MNQFKKLIYNEWVSEDGALFKFRSGVFDYDACQRLLGLLKKIDFGDQVQINRDLVTVLWEIPLFVYGLADINIQKQPDERSRIMEFQNNIEAECNRIFDYREGFSV